MPIEALEGSRDQVGRLVYAGGAKLTSDDPRFADIPRGGKIGFSDPQGDNIIHCKGEIKEFPDP